MANNFKVSVAARNLELDAMSVLLDGGFMDIYDGAQPATPETAVTTQVKLARLALNADFAPAAAAALLTANAVASDNDADATGVAAWFRLVKADGTAVCDGTVGTANADAIINAVAIAQHARVDCISLTIGL
jgi:hypothetical protein